ncbi:PEP-CTERM sorting domain-containing protein [Roseateles oligotrophus]|uniref:PEP-CTERM sorting domain-containing protein n=1 Tax=Roseateles oligotrophus TaxID=1769250 RepID=A0ABT2YKF3_9BURK|nr:PEP-CTERM sorting domain-containing protein [Roseateles oligotrophus]MCV2370536.1 PEP-CTERM sorting domain-containing protein [Roseateles oligotrophus]
MSKSKIALALALSIACASASAGPMNATELTLFRDGDRASWLAGQNILLNDRFDNGDAFHGPAFPNGDISTYSLRDLADGANPALAAREEGGSLLLDANYAVASVNASGGGLAKSLKLRLSTNTTDVGSGLDKSRSFAAALDLSLQSLPELGQTWGLRLSDSFSNTNDVIELFVHTNTQGTWIQFRKQDFLAQSITVLGATALNMPTGANGLILALSHDEANSDKIFGNYGYSDDNGLMANTLTTFATSTTAFHGENHTRIELKATQAVPEPSSWALWAAGAGVLLARRRRSRQD